MQTQPLGSAMNRRRGVTLVELVATAVVMLIVMGFVTTLCVQISHVWREIGHQRVALEELSNQLDRLTRLDPQVVETELESLIASDLVNRTLLEPELKGELVETEIGSQIRLQLDWKRRHPGKPVQLVGWIAGDLGIRESPE